MDSGDSVLLGSVLLCIITQVCCQSRGLPCQCPQPAPRCRPAVPLVLEGCHCCQVYAAQVGEACTDRMPCDSQRGLQCDYSASYPEGPGECVGQNALGCELNGMRLEEGQTFRPSCAHLCHCLGGGVTCVPLCTDDLQIPPAKFCPKPHLVRLSGQCCKEWICHGLDNSIYPDPLGVERPAETVEMARQDHGGVLSSRSLSIISNCIEQTTDWSPCSHSCGPGVSTRSSNKNWACRLKTETRLCQVRPCQVLSQVARRQQPGSGTCESSYTSSISVRLEHQGCWSTQAFRPRFCALACPKGHCCRPYHTRTVRVVFHCPQGRLTHHQVMMIESCSCSSYDCPQKRGIWRSSSWL